jgi:hypothetical protein
VRLWKDVPGPQQGLPAAGRGHSWRPNHLVHACVSHACAWPSRQPLPIVFLHVLSNNSVGSGFVLGRCLSRALASTLISSCLLLLSSLAQLARPGKLGRAQERIGDLPLVVDSLRRDTFNDVAGCLAGPTLEVRSASRLATLDTEGAFGPPLPMIVSPSCITRVCHDGQSVSSRVS